jgi:hypothetical protein
MRGTVLSNLQLKNGAFLMLVCSMERSEYTANLSSAVYTFVSSLDLIRQQYRVVAPTAESVSGSTSPSNCKK